MATRAPGWRNYTTDGTYWTVRKHGTTYWVVRINPTAGGYEWAQVWGGYQTAGHAAGAAAQLGYLQGRKDAREQLRAVLHGALDEIGLSAPVPAAPVPASAAPKQPVDDEGVSEE